MKIQSVIQLLSLICTYADFVRWHCNHEIIGSARLSVPLLTRCWLWHTVCLLKKKRFSLVSVVQAFHCGQFFIKDDLEALTGKQRFFVCFLEETRLQQWFQNETSTQSCVQVARLRVVSTLIKKRQIKVYSIKQCSMKKSRGTEKKRSNMFATPLIIQIPLWFILVEIPTPSGMLWFTISSNLPVEKTFSDFKHLFITLLKSPTPT